MQNRTMEFSDDVKTGLIAGAFGLAGTLIPVVLSWSRDRDAASTGQRKIDEATKRMAFWDQFSSLNSKKTIHLPPKVSLSLRSWLFTSLSPLSLQSQPEPTEQPKPPPASHSSPAYSADPSSQKTAYKPPATPQSPAYSP